MATTFFSLQAAHKRQHAAWWQDLVTVLLGTWLVLGVFVDGYAHNNLRSSIESFFTPWHAILYSGFTVTALWVMFLIVQQVRLGKTGLEAVPHGYGLGMVGAFIFGLGGLGDLIWHTLFGIEVGVDALLSPTHLMLLLGGVLLTTIPIRSAWSKPMSKPSLLEFLPVLLSMLLSLSFVTFMQMYLWVFTVGVLYSLSLETAGHLSRILFINVILTSSVLFLIYRWRTPFGVFSLLFGLNTLLMLVLGAAFPIHAVLMGFGIGLGVDALVLLLRPSPQRLWQYRAFAFLVPIIIWGGRFLTQQLSVGIGISLELWTGVTVMAALSGLVLSVLSVPPRVPVFEDA